MKRFFVITAFLLSTSQAWSLVDMRNANYANSWIDLESPGAGYDLRVVRTYNSRSLFNGMFGFGWCSDFETKIEVVTDQQIRIIECGAGQEIVFATKGSKISSSASTKTGTSVKDGTQFFANGSEVDQIVFSKGQFTRNMTDGSSQRFSRDGQLTHLFDKNNNFLKFEYDKELIREIVDNNGRKIAFKYYPNKKVRSITAPGGIVLDYKFSDMDNLASVKNGWGNTYTYSYDELHNLTKATYPDGTHIALTYDKKKDWVMSFTDREKCVEKYGYEFNEKDPKNHYWSTVEKTCGKEVVNNSRHEFLFKAKANGDTYLHRVSSKVNSALTEVVYHEVFNKPVSIRRNSDLYTFEYAPNGQIMKKIAPSVVLTYKYDPLHNKVSEVASEYRDDKGKPTVTRKTFFAYDKKGNIIGANNTDGLKVELTYDGKGRVATIKDQAKKLVQLQYEDRFGRPTVITRPNVGSIKVTYKPSGEIEKVDSKEGPSVAVQIASTFSNYIEVISPATAEVYNN